MLAATENGEPYKISSGLYSTIVTLLFTIHARKNRLELTAFLRSFSEKQSFAKSKIIWILSKFTICRIC